MNAHEVVIHGHRVTYRTAGDGPVLLLLHGIAGSSATWARRRSSVRPATA
jgi:pimeloyl-ACP methyl ester carboxylesterase